MGAVYHLHDSRLQQSVAGKALRSPDPDAIYRLKREFRTLAALRHPSLVRLYELFVGDDYCFFTMELVGGVGFLEHVRGRQDSPASRRKSRLDERRLRDALGQLAAAVAFLQREGKLHRDLKPGNVLVEGSGRVVVLDFGLASDLLSPDSVHSRAGTLAGTLAYMAPEQAAGEEIGPAADWYSVGVMLFEALTGTLPFAERGVRSLLERQQHPAPVPSEHCDQSIPHDLDRLATELLSPDPALRPDAARVLARLGAFGLQRAATRPRAPAEAGRTTFVGREAQLAQLERSLEESRAGLRVVRILGPSGIGKTSLVERFLASRNALQEVSLRSTCHPREKVPFNAIDGLIDGLARLLTHCDPDEVSLLLPRNASALQRTFPVMGRVPEIAALHGTGFLAAEPHEQRRQAFEALRELVARLGDRRPVVLWIDDAQWGDPDSAVALRELCRGADAPRVLLILCYRSEDGSDEAPAFPCDLDDLAPQHADLALGPLEDRDARRLAAEVLRASPETAGSALPGIVDGCRGNPFLVIEVARIAAETGGIDARSVEQPLTRLIAARVARLPAPGREVLEHVAVAGHPLEESLLSEALGHALEGLWDLAAQRLVRLEPLGNDTVVSCYHGAIAEAVLRDLPEARRIAVHRRLAGVLRRFPGRYGDTLVDHYLAAGDGRAAGNAAYELAEDAVRAAAFNRAIALYTRALELGTELVPHWLLLAKLATAEVNAGRGPSAAARFLEATAELERESPGDPTAVGLQRRAAFELLRSGLLEEGGEVLRQAFRRLGLSYPRSPVHAIGRIVLERTRLGVAKLARRPRERRRPTHTERERLELLWSAGQGLTFADMGRAAAFQAQHANLARRVGEARDLARALSTEALLVAWETGNERGQQRSEELLLEAERLAAESGDPLVQAHPLLMRAVTSLIHARWKQSLRLSEEGERLCLQECRGANWELASFRQNILSALSYLGELGLLRARLEDALRHADDRGDRFAISLLPIGAPNLAWLAADDPDEAERRVQQAVGGSFEARGDWFLCQGECARTGIELYRGEGLAALRRIERLWVRLRWTWTLRMPATRLVLRDLRAHCALHAAEHEAGTAAEKERLLELALRDARGNRAERQTASQPYALRVEGVVAALRGDHPTARQLLEKAAIGFRHIDMELMEACARWRAAGLDAGGSGDGEREAAERWMREHGVVEPERMVRLC